MRVVRVGLVRVAVVRPGLGDLGLIWKHGDCIRLAISTRRAVGALAPGILIRRT